MYEESRKEIHSKFVLQSESGVQTSWIKETDKFRINQKALAQTTTDRNLFEVKN